MDSGPTKRPSFFEYTYGRLRNPYNHTLSPGSEDSWNQRSRKTDEHGLVTPSPGDPFTFESTFTDQIEKRKKAPALDSLQPESSEPRIERADTLERPKPAIVKGLRANYRKFIPHLASIIVTTAVVQLSFRKQYWMDLQDPSANISPGLTQSGALNALQLAAKCHEVILVASLGKTVLRFAQHYLVGPRGLPLGFLTNSFLIGSGDFIFTKAFWSSVWSNKAHYWRFFTISLFAAMLAVLVGPSSAIAVIPSLNYYPLNAPFEQEMLPFYIFNHSTVLFPSNVTAASLNGPDSGINCTISSSSTSYQNVCPAGGFRETYDWALKLRFSNSTRGTNISLPDVFGESRRIVSTQSCETELDGRASGMSLPSFITSAMTAYWTFARNNYQGLALTTTQPRITLQGSLYAPSVEVLCDAHVYYNQTHLDEREANPFPSFDASQSLPEPGFETPVSGPMNATEVNWVPMPAGPEYPAIGSIIRVPTLYIRDNDSSLQQGTEIHACSIYAQWLPVDVFYQPRQEDQVALALKHPKTDTCLDVGSNSLTSTSRPPRNISIDLDYANAINQPIPFTIGPTPVLVAMMDGNIDAEGSIDNQTGYAFKAPMVAAKPLSEGIQLTPDESRRSHSTLIATLLAGVVTDGLARIAGNGIYPYSSPIFLTNQTTEDGGMVGQFIVSSAQGGVDQALNATEPAQDDWLRIDPIFSRYGYGYNWNDSRITQFGVIVLLIHLAIAVGHTLYLVYMIFIARQGLVGSWATISELLTLAMNSTPSLNLQDTCAGVDAAKTWRQVVSVRETQPGHLEMVVGTADRNKYPPPEVSKSYGHWDESSLHRDGMRLRAVTGGKEKAASIDEMS
ncbi:hypothetical protein B0A52_02244 [Exophiala mesophila]|uniref:Uncharacterized protein n=1 Tax=Exophiala mesophila TaxID=212818 RepID=A0A438NBX9_EXOME|nr:hypothetical protein B0A52_02244 [Exophiala mesophila]